MQLPNNNLQFNSSSLAGAFNVPELSKEQYKQSVYIQTSVVVRNLAETRFQYKNLPSELRSTLIEQYLTRYGMAAFFKHNGKFMVLPAAFNTSVDSNGFFDIYGDPVKVGALGMNLEQFDITNHVDGVIMGDNADYMPIIYTLGASIDNIVQASIRRRNNIRRLSSPLAFTADSSNYKDVSIMNTRNAIIDDDFALITNEGGGDIDTMDFSETYHGNEIQTEISNSWNTIYDTLGIDSINRVTASGMGEYELKAQDDSSHASGLAGYLMRVEKVKEINKMFGLNIEVIWSSNAAAQDDSDGVDSWADVAVDSTDTTDSSSDASDASDVDVQ